jgi:YfiH family protein
MQLHPDWLLPDWPAPANIRAVFTTRSGGVSLPPYDSMNVGDHVGDDPHNVATNRERLAMALGVVPTYLQQVHGTDWVHLEGLDKQSLCADAVLATKPGQVATIMVADCLPVLFTNRTGTLVASAHAGWRGLAAGVLEGAVRALAQSSHGCDAHEIIAWLGPCIGPTAFEVGPEVREAFVQLSPSHTQHFKPKHVHAQEGKFDADLAALARDQLRDLGVTALYGNDSSPAWCTVSNPSRFFSHRRDRISGRMAACIWMR